MRITFLSPAPNLSGGERVIAIYASKLALRGHDVEVVCARPDDPPTRQKLKLFLMHGRWPARPTVGPSHYANYGVHYRVVNHAGPLTDDDIRDGDILVATFWPTVYWALRLRSSKGRAVFLAQGYEQPHQRTEWSERIRHELEQAWRAELPLITVSTWLARLAYERFGRSATVIRNGAEIPPAEYRAPRSARRRRIGLMFTPDYAKGCDIAAHALLALNAQVRVDLVGFGASPPPAELPFREYQLCPHQLEIHRIYGSSEVWLFPSRAEGFGLPILEAMACGTPVVGTPAGAAPELLAQGGGVLVPHENPMALAEAIIRICQMSDDQWQQMSDAAYRTASAYTWDDATTLFENVLLDLANQAKPGVQAQSSRHHEPALCR
ncbi:glycosyltransferase family 4 protein [Fontivita pretiosa]|uniref:glycosyltransferase family 4 protein n=1 Tax=Fontivita pretiosa TaxID=2989684 RepID=UPI003D166D6B